MAFRAAGGVADDLGDVAVDVITVSDVTNGSAVGSSIDVVAEESVGLDISTFKLVMFTSELVWACTPELQERGWPPK